MFINQGRTRLILLTILLCSFISVFAQKETTTLILVRHAEKDTGYNPGLTDLGKRRAERLSSLFPNAKPDEFYATPYNRTIQTIQPWATATNKSIATYSPQNLAQLAETLKSKKGKTIVVAGHSNTTPALANLLLGNEKYSELNEADYDKIFVITITKGKPKATVVTAPLNMALRP